MRIRLLTIAALLLLLVPAAARATTVADVASALREDPVFNETDAERALSPSDADELRSRIRRSDTPIYIAILPQRAIGSASGDSSADALIQDIAQKTGKRGIYGLVVGNEFRGGNIGVDHYGPEEATAAFNEHSQDGTRAVLDAFVDKAAEDYHVGIASGGNDSGGGGGFFDFLPGFSFFWVVAAGIVALQLVGLARRGRRRRESAAELADVKLVAQEDLAKLQQDVIDLDPIYTPGKDEETDAAYQMAQTELERAQRRLDAARRVADLSVVSRAIEEGRYHLACARARIEGKEQPARRAPCFFNPQHGPSTAAVWWTPPDGGPARDVPACAVCARQVEEGREPASREIFVGGQRMPHWQAPRYYAPWMGGYYGWSGSGFGLGDVFTGFLIGEAVSGAWSHHDAGSAVVGSDGSWVGGGGGDWSGSSSGGDSGGGWFGGGGGDWGGGGGGGDWGGGGGDSGGGGGDSGGGGGW